MEGDPSRPVVLTTVTTLQDRLANVERFVARNLGGGVDHMVVVIDDPTAPGQAEVADWLDQHPAVTCIRGDDAWWRGRRPPKLNRRQHANANAVKHALSGLPWASWLAHIDGDEVLSVDRDILAGFNGRISVLRFEVWEVSTDGTAPPEGAPTWFKRPLSADELALLEALGIIDQPRNQAYFHGHLHGKSAVRPSFSAWLSCHDVLDGDGTTLPATTDPGLRVYHLESADVGEFERKWEALLDSPVAPALRPSRERLAAALRGLFALDLPTESRQRCVRELFARHRADDVRRLRDLGLLQPVRWPTAPLTDGLSAPQLVDLATALRQLPRLGVARFAKREQVLKTGIRRAASL